AWIALGQAQLELRRHDDARTSFDRALALAPEDAEALVGRGMAHHKLREFKRAIADYRAALAHGDDAELAHRLECAEHERDYEDTLAKHTKNILDDSAAAELGFDRGGDDISPAELVALLEKSYGVRLPARYRKFLESGEDEPHEAKVAGSDGGSYYARFVSRCLADDGELLSNTDMGFDGDEFREEHPTLIPFAVLAWDEPPDYQAIEGQFLLIDVGSERCAISMFTSEAEVEERAKSLDEFLQSLDGD